MSQFSQSAASDTFEYLERLRAREPVTRDAALLAAAHQPGVGQEVEVTRHVLLGGGQLIGERLHIRLAGQVEPIDELNADRLTEQMQSQRDELDQRIGKRPRKGLERRLATTDTAHA
jgi:hypothetical protein